MQLPAPLASPRWFLEPAYQHNHHSEKRDAPTNLYCLPGRNTKMLLSACIAWKLGHAGSWYKCAQNPSYIMCAKYLASVIPATLVHACCTGKTKIVWHRHNIAPLNVSVTDRLDFASARSMQQCCRAHREGRCQPIEWSFPQQYADCTVTTAATIPWCMLVA